MNKTKSSARNLPKVTIIILNYNGRKWLAKCLPTVKKLSYKNLEVLVVNNGSSDDSGDYVKSRFPEFKLLEIKKNRGFVGGNNFGVKKAQGKYILLLNNDTKVTPNFLHPMVERMEKDNSVGALQPQIRSMRNISLLDSVAAFYTTSGFLYHYGYYQESKKKQYQKELPVYSIKGACFFMRRDDYLNLGGLDEDFVCYVEESDLCHRIWLSGKKVIYLPTSYIYHYGGGDMSIMEKNETTAFRTYRNRFYSYIKNLSTVELLKIIPIHLLFSEIYILLTLMRGKVRNAIAGQLGILWCVINIRKILKKRKFVQNKIRKVRDRDFMPLVTRNPPFSYYIHFFTNPEGKYFEKPI